MVQLLEKGEHNPSQDQPRSSRDPQLAVCVVAALSRARGSGLCANPSVSKSTRSGSSAHGASTHCSCGATVWTTGLRTRSPALGGGCAKKSQASAPIQERHAILERLGEQMAHLSGRRLCRLVGVNRHWDSQHRCPSAHQESDQRLRAAIQVMREEAPHRCWVADLTYVRLPEGEVFLACLLDVFSRTCIGWSLSGRSNAQLPRPRLGDGVSPTTGSSWGDPSL